jgi:hypothetical protein
VARRAQAKHAFTKRQNIQLAFIGGFQFPRHEESSQKESMRELARAGFSEEVTSRQCPRGKRHISRVELITQSAEVEKSLRGIGTNHAKNFATQKSNFR